LEGADGPSPRFDVDAQAGIGQIEHPVILGGGSSYKECLNQTPVNDGCWSGERGESTFFSGKDSVRSITMDRGVDYSGARPDFNPYSAADVEIEGMSTNRRTNFRLADEKLASEMGVSRLDVTQWREQSKYTWHEDNTTRMQLVPSPVNSEHGHLGGVAELKRLQKKSGGQ